MKKVIVLVSLFSFLSVGYGQCVADSAANVLAFTYNGKVYEIVKETKNWVAAAACALERGGELVEINDQAEQDTVCSAINSAGITAANTIAPDGGGASYLWIGGNDLATEGVWVWDGNNNGIGNQFWQGTTTGSAVGGLYNNWGNEPDDFNGQDALAFAFTDWPLGVAGEWNDVGDENALYFIIEHPDPSNTIEEQEITKINVYPNPSKDEVTLELPFIFDIPTHQKILIYDNAGKLIEEILIAGEITKIDVSMYENGVYHIYVNETFVKEFIVSH